MRARRGLTLCATSLTFLHLGCAGDPPEERFETGAAAVEEDDIRGALLDGDVELIVPVTRRTDGPLSGLVRVELVDVAGAEPVSLGSSSRSFDQEALTAEHRLRVPGAGADLERIDTATIVVEWRVDLSGRDLFGKRSLYAALGNLDLQLRGPTEVARGATSPLRVIVRDPDTGAVISGANVEAALISSDDEGNEVETALFSGETDALGELLGEVALPDGIASGDVRVTVTHDGAQVWADHRLSLRADEQLYLGSDKTIYKPGQSIHLRLLALDGPDRLPLTEQDVLFEAKDGRGNKVFKRRAVTDAFGVAAMTVPTDTRVNEGEWVMTAQVGDRSTELRLPVERYNLPKMRIALHTDRAFVLPGETIEGRVDAQYLFGEPVVGATVNIDVRTATGLVLSPVSTVTDAEGGATFQVEVPESAGTAALEDHGDQLLLSATVIDTADQLERGQTALALAAAPLQIQLITDAGTLVSGAENLLYAIVTDPLGRPVQAELLVEGISAPVTATDATGVAEIRFTPTTEAVALTVTATDGGGRTHARNFDLATSDGERLRVSTDKGVYAPGDTATVLIQATAEVSRAYVDLYRGASGVASTEVDLVDGMAEIRVPVTEELGGVLVLDALAITGEGDALRSTRPVVVERNDRLRVTVAPAAESYRPGEEASLEVQVTDQAGNPEVASIGLQVIDDAAFALGGEPTTNIGQVFGLDSRVLPASLTVAGRGADTLFEIEDPAARDRLARILFAEAGSVEAPNFHYSSLAEEIPVVVSRLETRVQLDANALLEDVADAVRQGWVTEENVVAASDGWRLTDPFGRPYEITVEEGEYDSRDLILVSAGPDERARSRDDVTVRTNMNWVFWGPAHTRGGTGAEEQAFNDFDTAGAAPPEQAAEPNADDSREGGGATVRSDFREAAYINPTLVTDASGRATVGFRLPHSITTWRVTAEGSTANGKGGGVRDTFRTFQSFFVDFTMPTDLTAGDRLELPAVVYNYTDSPKTVSVSLDSASWFSLLSPASQTVDLGPSEVRAVRFEIEVNTAGTHQLTIRGTGDGIADAIVRSAEVSPEGHPEDETVSGTVTDSALHSISIPDDTVENGARVEIAVTPGFAAEAVSGLEGMLQEPNGCFEQTTSTAWPNTLVADYLEKTGQMTPEMREEVIGVVTRGYQRLLTFESPTGGFNWWGDSDPGNRILSAIFLWHLKDLEELIEVDTDVRDRTLSWLLAQQNADGSFDAGDALHAGNEVLGTSVARTTGFIAWALAHTDWADDAAARATGYLEANLPTEEDLYANALVANALVMTDPSGAATTDMLTRLDALKVDLGEDGLLWPTDAPSWTGSGGDAAALETTGLVAYGLMNAGSYATNVRGAMQYIIRNKDSVGTWYNTQATMNALRALSAAASPSGSSANGTLTVRINGVLAHTIDVTPENGDVYRRFDITDFVGTGNNTVELSLTGTGEVSYQVTRRAYRPAAPPATGPLALSVTYDQTETQVGEPVLCHAEATNADAEARNQVMVRVGRAPGFVPRTEDLEHLVAQGIVSRYEVRADDVTFYLMNMEAGETRALEFRLTPGLAVDATAAPSTIYAYYEPTLRQTLEPTRFLVTSP